MTDDLHFKAARIVLGLAAPGRPDAALDDAIRFWESRLGALDTGDTAPPPDLWDRIEARIDHADKAPGTRTIAADEGVWEDAAPGIRRKIVHVDRRAGTQSYFVRMEKGAVMPTHAHGADEHCIVLSGRLRVGGATFGPGTYHFAQSGVDHVELIAVEPAEFFIHGGL